MLNQKSIDLKDRGRPRNSWHDVQLKEIQSLLKESTDADNLRRIQAIYFRLAYDYTSEQIADMTGFCPGTIRRWHSRFMREGIKILKPKEKSKKKTSAISFKQEQAIIQEFIKKTETEAINISDLKAFYELKVGYAVFISEIHVMLQRHGWRQAQPITAEHAEMLELFMKHRKS